MPANLRIQKISGHAGTVPGTGTQRQETVAKLIDTTTCIGCKACEVACMEWNDLPFRETTFNNSYQTMPRTEWNYWNLIQFREHQRDDGTLMWLMRKDQCMHCADPGCLAACPADNAIVQYQNGIVDFQQDYCIGCQYCVTGCPFNIPRFNPADQEDVQVHAVHRSRLAGPGAGLHQGLPHGLPALRHEGRYEGAGREPRAAIARAFCLRQRRRLRSRQASAARA